MQIFAKSLHALIFPDFFAHSAAAGRGKVRFSIGPKTQPIAPDAGGEDHAEAGGERLLEKLLGWQTQASERAIQQ